MSTKTPAPPTAVSRLRAAAEARLADAAPAAAHHQAADELLHDLQVHQIELEMQAETLRQARDALEESRDRYVDLYEFAPVGYLTLTDDGLIAEANLTAATMLGVERKQLVKRRFDRFVAASDLDRWRRRHFGTLNQEGAWAESLMLQRSDGSTFFVEAKCLRLGRRDSRPPALRMVLTDVTERKRADLALVEQEALYRAVIETAADGIWVVDGQGRILAVNEAYARRSGYSREQLLAMHIADIEVQESADDVRAHIENVRREGSDLFETRHRTRDGEVWSVEVNTSYSPAAGGRYFGFLRDITERRRNETALGALRAEMEQLMRHHVARQTIAAIAHELNQPLYAACSYSEAALRMLDAGIPKPERLQHALTGCAQQAQRAGQVLRELLAFMNKGEVRIEPVDIYEVAAAAVAWIEASLDGDGQVRLEPAPESTTVSTDRLQVQKVLANLIQNSIEAMQDAGIAPVNVTVTVSADGKTAQVTVKDAGPGIDAQTLQRIFDPFFSTKPKGLGMGLAISRALVEALGGRLWAESAPGAGASFHLTLPRAP